MADKLSFALVSPERELFNGDVDHVVVPGAEGEFGVLPNHAPVMSVIKPGRAARASMTAPSAASSSMAASPT
jgi:F0F1-type ATP synthase epsilon subunit